jgi:hypothetical protein
MKVTRLACTVSLVLAFAACGSSDEGGSDATVAAGTFTGTVVDFASKAPMEGVDLQVLDNVTGQPLDAAKYPVVKSGAGGAVSLELPKGLEVGFKTWGNSTSGLKFKDGFQFNIASDAQAKRLYAVNIVTYAGALSTAYIKAADETIFGHLAGSVYYKNKDGQDEFVGCVVIQVYDEAGKLLEEVTDATGRATEAGVRYFDTKTDLPTSLAVSDMTHKLSSRFMVANLKQGRYTAKAFIKDRPDVVIGTVPNRTFPGAISIGNLYVVDPANPDKNPTPDLPECEGESGHR